MDMHFHFDNKSDKQVKNNTLVTTPHRFLPSGDTTCCIYDSSSLSLNSLSRLNYCEIQNSAVVLPYR